MMTMSWTHTLGSCYKANKISPEIQLYILYLRRNFLTAVRGKHSWQLKTLQPTWCTMFTFKTGLRTYVSFLNCFTSAQREKLNVHNSWPAHPTFSWSKQQGNITTLHVPWVSWWQSAQMVKTLSAFYGIKSSLWCLWKLTNIKGRA